MKLSIARDGLLEALKPTHRIAPGNGQVPVLSHVLLEAGAGSLALFGTDLQVVIRTERPAHVDRPGRVALSAKRFHDIVPELPEAEVEIEADKGPVLAIRCQGTRFRLKGLPAEDFPAQAPVSDEHALRLPARVLRDLIRKAVSAVSPDQSRPMLTGALLQAQAEEIRLVATDGHRLALARHPREGAMGDGCGLDVVIPRKALGEILRGLRDEEGDVALTITEDQVTFTQPGQTLTSRLLEGAFPDYERAIPADISRRAEVAREALAEALRRTAAIEGDRVATTAIELQPDRLLVSCTSPELGEAREEVDAHWHGEPPSVAFNTRYLLEFLEATEADLVTLALTDPTGPAVFQVAGDPTYTYVLMPVRL
jgi:DNA polymerase-3 subunit beta